MYDIDLDRLAEGYRLRPISSAARRRAIESADGIEGLLLDIGGGTGAHAALWRGPRRTPVVIDPSRTMLDQTRSMHDLTCIRATSQLLPLGRDVAQLAYFHLSIHYGDWVTSLDEAFRVVCPGGRIEVWTISPDAIGASSLGRWFPSVVAIDSVRFPDPALIAERCAMSGGDVSLTATSEPIERSAGAWMEAVRSRFVSTLQLLDQAEIDEGLSRFAEEYPDPESLYRYELKLTRISTIIGPLR